MPAAPAPVSLWQTIATVFRQNRVPGLLLNGLVVGLVASYYAYPEVAEVWRQVGEVKSRWGYGFSCVSTLVAAVFLPFLMQACMGTLPPVGTRLRRLGGQCLFWGLRGMEIDLFYRLQGAWFGHDNDARTLFFKVVADQFGYSILWSVPTCVVALRWIEMDCSWRRTWPTLDGAFWRRTVPTVLLTNWMVWIPAVTLVYSLPPPLQFPLFSVIMSFFVLIITLLSSRPAGRGEAREG